MDNPAAIMDGPIGVDDPSGANGASAGVDSPAGVGTQSLVPPGTGVGPCRTDRATVETTSVDAAAVAKPTELDDERECWHEVVIKAMVHPVDGRCAGPPLHAGTRGDERRGGAAERLG